jgi:protein gp37
LKLKGIAWAIVGGESGPEALPMDPQWVDDIHVACRRAGLAFSFKQRVGRNKKAAGRTLGGRTWGEYPAGSFPP